MTVEHPLTEPGEVLLVGDANLFNSTEAAAASRTSATFREVR